MATVILSNAFGDAQAESSFRRQLSFGAVAVRGGRLEKAARHWSGPACKVFTVLAYLSVGIGFYHAVEGWSPLDSVYFACVTMSTVGYGDFSPTTAGSKVFTVAYIFFGIGFVFAQVIVVMGTAVAPMYRGSRRVMEWAFPQRLVDIDGDGSADFKVREHSK